MTHKNKHKAFVLYTIFFLIISGVYFGLWNSINYVTKGNNIQTENSINLILSILLGLTSTIALIIKIEYNKE